MTAKENLTGAPFHVEIDWQAINWRKVNQNVRRLQARIVKAIQEKRWGKVKALMHLLTHSFSAKARAVKRVTENRGKRTPGVDGIIWSTPKQKGRAISSMRQHGYRAQPLKRVYIPKSKGQKRPLGIPTQKDRAMQALYKQALNPVAETTADPNSYGFRPQRSTADAIEKCFKALHRPGSAQWVLEGDIKGCFDNISHEWLASHIPMDKNILSQWLKAGYIEKSALYPTKSGTPQGGLASPVLANMTLDGLEARLDQHFPPQSNKRQRAKIHFVRYADDFVITGSSREDLEQEVIPLVKQFLAERGLTLSKAKTRLTHIKDGFDFLGQNIRKYNGKLLIKPARKSVKSLLSKIRTLIKSNPVSPPERLIAQLNPILRGWAYYHRHVVSKRTFSFIDHRVFQRIWRWATTRHPNKSKQWVKDKFFQDYNGRDWVFYADKIDRHGNPSTSRLFITQTGPIKRHIKVRADANPYDPTWETYFENRWHRKMNNTLKGRTTLLYLWRKHNGFCPVCKQIITPETGWHSHHIVWRSLGGSDTVDNRVLLHPQCHQQVHCQGFEKWKVAF